MFILSDDNAKAVLEKWIKIYLFAAAGTLIFSAIYEHFSHEVYSAFMLGACLIPLALGALPLAAAKKKAGLLPGNILLQIQACSISTLTVGSIFKGVLEIYGTTNDLTLVYAAIGGILFAAFAGIYGAGLNAFRKRAKA